MILDTIGLLFVMLPCVGVICKIFVENKLIKDCWHSILFYFIYGIFAGHYLYSYIDKLVQHYKGTLS